jgi:hypothetical protein
MAAIGMPSEMALLQCVAKEPERHSREGGHPFFFFFSDS